jgi:predicted solute-binding protein
MNSKLDKKSKSLKLAIEKYNEYKSFVDVYNKTKSLDSYIEFINKTINTLSEDLSERYEKMIYIYNNGNKEPLLSNLYDRLLAADENKNKIADELKALLREL